MDDTITEQFLQEFIPAEQNDLEMKHSSDLCCTELRQV
jgi:hypothetical protein